MSSWEKEDDWPCSPAWLSTPLPLLAPLLFPSLSSLALLARREENRRLEGLHLGDLLPVESRRPEVRRRQEGDRRPEHHRQEDRRLEYLLPQARQVGSHRRVVHPVVNRRMEVRNHTDVRWRDVRSVS